MPQPPPLVNVWDYVTILEKLVFFLENTGELRFTDFEETSDRRRQH